MPTVELQPSTRTKLVEGMFDVPPAPALGVPDRRGPAAAPGLDFDWQVGLIVGPSGSGKTTLARQLAAASESDLCVGPEGLDWEPELALIDQIEGGVRDAAGTLTAVGLG